MRVIDITGPIEEGMWKYDHPIGSPVIEEVASVEGTPGWQAHRFTLWSLTGTYLEAAAHLFTEGERIDQVAPERFVRPASILHLPECPPGHPITASELAATGVTLEPGDAALLATGWDRMWNKPGFVTDGPFLTMDAMEWLVESGASIIGGDIPAFDNPDEPAGVNFRLFGAGCLILAPLVNLTQVEVARPTLVALPLRVKGVCGTPCRAILMDL